jgi:hypothetical protein
VQSVRNSPPRSIAASGRTRAAPSSDRRGTDLAACQSLDSGSQIAAVPAMSRQPTPIPTKPARQPVSEPSVEIVM